MEALILCATSHKAVKAFQETAESFLRFFGAEHTSSRDAFIAVMGMTGSGKSAFISRCINKTVKIGPSLLSCTKDVSIHSFSYGLNRVHLIDTPGWDDTNRSDAETLKTVAQYLSVSYANGIRLTGLLYLHRISDNRMHGSAKRNLDIFKALCGTDAFPWVFLITTIWSNAHLDSKAYEDEERREQQLESSFWAELLAGGGTMLRHETDSRGSALRIIDEVLCIGCEEKVSLAIQKEMIDQELLLEQTTAGREVNKELTLLRDKLQADINEVQRNLTEAQCLRDKETSRKLATLENNLHMRVAEAEIQSNELKKSLEEVYRENEARILQALEDMRVQSQREITAKEEELRAAEESAAYLAREMQQEAQREAHRKKDQASMTHQAAQEKTAERMNQQQEDTDRNDETRHYEQEEFFRKLKEQHEQTIHENQAILREIRNEVKKMKENYKKREATSQTITKSLASGTASGIASGIASGVLSVALPAVAAGTMFCVVM